MRAFFGKLNRLQNSRGFKIGASLLIVLLAVAFVLIYAVGARLRCAPRARDPGPQRRGARRTAGRCANLSPRHRRIRDTQERLLRGKTDVTSVVVGAAVVAGLLLGAVWLGLGLTLLGLGLAAGLIVAPLLSFERTHAAGVLTGGLVALTASFVVLMRLASLAFSGTGAVPAIAKNVLSEAVRLKLSMVFIIMVIFMLASLPGLLDAEQPLRYRVQSFLQYATGGAFWIIALLVVLFAVATVTFEQRDKIIWQTMTKPVRAWQYVLGKWLGVSTLGLVLLAVCGSAIFLFTEYLRNQPARGESAPYVSLQGDGLTQDRLDLETQVLSSRLIVRPDPVVLDEAQFAENVEEFVRNQIANLSAIDDSSAEIRKQREQEIRDRFRSDLRKSVENETRNMGPGENRIFYFSNLGAAKDSRLPVILRYKVNSGSNPPDKIYKLTVSFPGVPPPDIEAELQRRADRGETPVLTEVNAFNAEVQDVALGQFHSMAMLPEVVSRVRFRDGTEYSWVTIMFVNGDVNRRIVNEESSNFPPDGLEISYSTGSYRSNFLRVMGVLWLKLAFLSMLGVCLGTFLSFPVAAIVSMAVFFTAEGARFILGALENYATATVQGAPIYFNQLIAFIAKTVATAFRTYSDLQPVQRLVEGERLAWADVTGGAAWLLVAFGLLFAAASLVFSRRELATYSGHA